VKTNYEWLQVSWNWGSGHPSGKVAAIESEGATIQTAGKE